MIAIIFNYRPLLYSFYLNNNSGNQDRPPEAGCVPAKEFWLNL